MPSALERLQAATEPPAPSGPPRRRGIVAGLVAVALLVLGKIKLVGLAAIKLLGLFPTLWTMVLSTVAYSASMGFGLAALLVLLILVHELGHAAAARRAGLRVGAPVFIPFFGAFIALKDRAQTPAQRFAVAAGGPVFGGAAGLLVLAAGAVLAGDPLGRLLRVGGYLAVVMNLFNLLPGWILDGAAMFRALRRRDAAVGLAVAAAALVATAIAGAINVVGIVVLAVGAFELGAKIWRARRPPAQDASLLARLEAARPVAPADQELDEAASMRAAAVYFGLVAAYIAAVQLVAPQ